MPRSVQQTRLLKFSAPRSCAHVQAYGDQTRKDGAPKQWIDAYERASASYAACRFLEIIGNNEAISEAEPVLELHDELSRAHRKLDVA
jgi:hypothetical protein